jgi:hypothetical protein
LKRVLILLLALGAGASVSRCSDDSPRPGGDGGSLDAGQPDADGSTIGRDAGGPDIGQARLDASDDVGATMPLDAGPSGSKDAGSADAGFDAGALGPIDCKAVGVVGITGPTIVYDVPWVVDSGNADHTGNGTIPDMQPGMAWVGIIRVPPGAPQSPTITGRIDIHEYPDAPHMRWVTVSTTPCTWGQPGDGSYTEFDLGPSFLLTVGPNSFGSTTEPVIPMPPGATYYVNVRVQSPSKPTGNQCGSSTCNFVLEFFKPNGT